MFSTACDSASITSVVSKWRSFSFYLQSGNREVGWTGDYSHVVFGQKFPCVKELWDGALAWWDSQFFCRQSSGRSLYTFSRNRRKTVWPARTNSLWTIPLMSKKMMSMHLTLRFTCLSFFSLGEFWLSVYCSSFLPECLSNHFEGLRLTFPRFAQNLMLFLCRIHREIASCITTPNKRT
jgi:hypothetical protein